MCWRDIVAAATIACLVASPAAAENLGSYFPDRPERATAGTYVGATLSVLRSSERSAGPSLRIGLGARQQAGQFSAGLSAPGSSAIELDLTAARRPQLYFAGRNLSAAQGDGGWGASEILLAIAAVAGAALLITAVAGSDDNNDEERCLIEPELCD